MTKVLSSAHAEDVGGYVVEPGAEIPSDADPAVIARLDAEGKLTDAPAKPRATRKTEED